MITAGTILHVEDREDDVFLLQYTFKRVGITHPIQIAEDGQQAIDYLAGNGPFADRQQYPLPCLILLDLKLPHKMGLDVLRWVRQQPSLQSLIIIILTSSAYRADIEQAYRLGANAFLVKPADSNIFTEMCTALKQFWLTHNQPPPGSPETS